MVKPPFDLDSDFHEALEKFRQECMELAYKCVVAAREAGVPQNALYQWSPDPDKNVDWQPLPDVFSDYIEFSGEVWRHQDTDYVSFRLDRRVMSGDITVDRWVVNKLDEYVKETARRELEAEQARLRTEAELREKRRARYEELKEEFGD